VFVGTVKSRERGDPREFAFDSGDPRTTGLLTGVGEPTMEARVDDFFLIDKGPIGVWFWMSTEFPVAVGYRGSLPVRGMPDLIGVSGFGRELDGRMGGGRGSGLLDLVGGMGRGLEALVGGRGLVALDGTGDKVSLLGGSGEGVLGPRGR
jgi:hypothetical protein